LSKTIGASKTIIKLGWDAVIQHGKANNKGYKIMKYDAEKEKLKNEKKSQFTERVNS